MSSTTELPGGDSAAGGGVFELRLVAGPAAPVIVRSRLREWLIDLGWPDDDAYDLAVAVNEAATNVVEHAYLLRAVGDVRVTARDQCRDGRRYVVVTVRDWGRWRPAVAGPGARGRGLGLMRSLMQWLRVEHREAGTSVTMASSTGSQLELAALATLVPGLVPDPPAAQPLEAVPGGRADLRRDAAALCSRAAELVADGSAACSRAADAVERSARLVRVSAEVVATARRVSRRTGSGDNAA